MVDPHPIRLDYCRASPKIRTRSKANGWFVQKRIFPCGSFGQQSCGVC